MCEVTDLGLVKLRRECVQYKKKTRRGKKQTTKIVAQIEKRVCVCALCEIERPKTIKTSCKKKSSNIMREKLADVAQATEFN